MASHESNLERLLQQMQRDDRLLRQHLGAFRDPYILEREHAAAMAEETRRLQRYADELTRAQKYAEEARRWSQIERNQEIERIAGAARLATAATSAFDAIYADMRRAAELGEQCRRSTEATQLLYEQARVASLYTSTAQRELALPGLSVFEPLTAELAALTRSAVRVLNGLSAIPETVNSLSDWQIQAPTLVPYAGASSLVVFRPTAPALAGYDGPLDSLLDEVGDSIEDRLISVSPALATPYRGARSALVAAGPDWRRHVGVSLRSVLEGLLDALAPEDALYAFFDEPEVHRHEGRFTRKAKLIFIFREIAIDGYAQMAENDMQMTLATFYPANEAVHELTSTLTERQGRVLLRRVQGCLLTILATQE